MSSFCHNLCRLRNERFVNHKFLTDYCNSEWCINKSLVFRLWKEYKESIKAYTEIYDAEMWIDNHSSNKLDLKQIISITKEEWEQIIIDVDYIKYMYDL